jgi:hypothetical protein
MRKNKLGSILIYFFVLSLVMIPASCKNVELQLGFILDGSSSIIPSDWTLMVKGLAKAVSGGTFPKDGSVELTVVQIGVSGGAKVEVFPEVVTASSAPGIVSKISVLPQGMGTTTPLACGFRLLADTMLKSPNFNPSKKQIINIITDGGPNACCDVIGIYVGGSCKKGSNFLTSTVSARNDALKTLNMTPNQDLITCELVGSNLTLNWLRDSIVWPQQGTIAPLYSSNKGWVRMISTFKDLEAAINEKIKAIVSPKKSKKVSSTQINQNINQNTMGMSGIGGLRTGSIWLSQNGVNIANVNGSNNQISQNINQNALGTARLR